ncbi:MAG: AAA family ATPase [Planctomycetes bacterium]|nr:AAA family ATPase [Planctomycetota bacterium]MCK5473286.1 AAA family ATPase [Planctomycetota bacterium]
MRTIAIVNQKGGCGKTTVSINLASALAEAGKKTLLVDMDPQSHCAVGLAVPEEQIEQCIYDVLISGSRGEPMKLAEILWQISGNLELAPASIDLSAFEQQMAGVAERQNCLRDVLHKVRKEYEYVIIDCPPAVGLLTFNALSAATDVIVPVETGYFALHGLSKQLETLNILCQRCSQQVNVGVLASMYDVRTKMAREILAELRSHFSDKMFRTIVNFNTKIKEASSFGQPITEYAPASKGKMDFSSLADEIIGSDAKQQRSELVNSLASQLESISTSASELLKTTKLPKAATDRQRPASSKKIAEPEIVELESKKEKTVSEPKVEPCAAKTDEIVNVTLDEKIINTALDKVAEQIDVSFESLEIDSLKKEISQIKAEQEIPVDHEALKKAADTVVNEVLEEIETEIKAETEAIEAAEEVPPVEDTQLQLAEETVDTNADAEQTVDMKLSDYYGVSQINEAIAFVTFYPLADTVQIAGDFNNWQPEKTTMQKVGESGVWQADMKMPSGKYRYRLVVDGQWQQDPYNENAEANPFGGFNSVLEVK